jgi:phosphoglucosamine mutase
MNKAVLAAVSDVESRLGKSGRVLLRPSGTEPVVRVMVEGEDPAIVESLARELAEIVSTELASAD